MVFCFITAEKTSFAFEQLHSVPFDGFSAVKMLENYVSMAHSFQLPLEPSLFL
jgi:hypothetical protein